LLLESRKILYIVKSMEFLIKKIIRTSKNEQKVQTEGKDEILYKETEEWAE